MVHWVADRQATEVRLKLTREAPRPVLAGIQLSPLFWDTRTSPPCPTARQLWEEGQARADGSDPGGTKAGSQTVTAGAEQESRAKSPRRSSQETRPPCDVRHNDLCDFSILFHLFNVKIPLRKAVRKTFQAHLAISGQRGPCDRGF